MEKNKLVYYIFLNCLMMYIVMTLIIEKKLSIGSNIWVVAYALTSGICLGYIQYYAGAIFFKEGGLFYKMMKLLKIEVKEK